MLTTRTKMGVQNSELPGFYKLSVEERRKKIAEVAGLPASEVDGWQPGTGVDIGILDRMIENVVGAFSLPLGIATHFLVNGKDYLVPMAIEEPSVVAAASHAAKIARAGGGFHAMVSAPQMIGQVQILGAKDPHGALHRILEDETRLLELANAKDPVLAKVGGGARRLEARVVESPRGPMIIVHLVVDVRDAMGANAVNTMSEALAPEFARLAEGRSHLRIISNLAIYRVARSRAVFPRDSLAFGDWKGSDVVDGILDAWAMAACDPFRCATHNKGIMNGISAVAIATGNDFRALESGAHSYAAWKARPGGVIAPLSTYEQDANGNLVGTIELPMAVGTVGGATVSHPTARLNVRLLGISGAEELARVITSVGLAQNFAALRALATEGIQKGHMSLHARNVAMAAGANASEVDRVAEALARSGTVRIDKAKEILSTLRSHA